MYRMRPKRPILRALLAAQRTPPISGTTLMQQYVRQGSSFKPYSLTAALGPSTAPGDVIRTECINGWCDIK